MADSLEEHLQKMKQKLDIQLEEINAKQRLWIQKWRQMLGYPTIKDSDWNGTSSAFFNESHNHNNNNNSDQCINEIKSNSFDAQTPVLSYNETQILLYESNNKYESVLRENESLKQRLKNLYRYAMQGIPPMYNSVALIHSNGMVRSKSLQSIFNSLQNKHNNSKENVVKIAKNKYDYWNDYASSILQFVSENGIYNKNPHILISKNGQIFRKIEQNETVEAYTISNHPRIPALNGQKGLKSKVSLPMFTVIGQYIGIETNNTEYDGCYYGTTEGAFVDKYAFEINIYPEFKDENMEAETNNNNTNNDNNNNNNNNNDNYDSNNDNSTYNNITKETEMENEMKNEDKSNKDFKLVIDPIRMERDEGTKNVMLHINDCRKNINHSKPTPDDEKEQNVEFVEAYVNDWPMLFVVTCQKVKQNSELTGYYGSNYGEVVSGEQKYTKLMKHNGKEIQKICSL